MKFARREALTFMFGESFCRLTNHYGLRRIYPIEQEVGLEQRNSQVEEREAFSMGTLILCRASSHLTWSIGG